MRTIWERFNDWWCRSMHHGTMWPTHGVYRCRQCMREHTISWAHDLPA